MRRFACCGCILRSTNPEQRQSRNQLGAACGMWLFLRKNFHDLKGGPGQRSRPDHFAEFCLSTSMTFSIVFQLRVVAGTPRSFSILPR
jgi:hypothetical protein